MTQTVTHIPNLPVLSSWLLSTFVISGGMNGGFGWTPSSHVHLAPRRLAAGGHTGKWTGQRKWDQQSCRMQIVSVWWLKLQADLQHAVKVHVSILHEGASPSTTKALCCQTSHRGSIQPLGYLREISSSIWYHERAALWFAESDSEHGTYGGDNSVNIILRGPLLSQCESV